MKIKQAGVVAAMVAAIFAVTGTLASVHAGKLGNWAKTSFGGCYKQSEVVYDKCSEEVDKYITKKDNPTMDELIDLDKQCVNKAKNFLLKCRKDKGKLKPEMKGKEAQMDAELTQVYGKNDECRRELMRKCWEDNVAKGQKPTAEQSAKFTRCVNSGIPNCDNDALENEVMEKYISTEE